MERIKRYLIELDLFSESSLNIVQEDHFKKRLNIIITRTYLILLFIILLIVVLIWSMSNYSEQISIESPSLYEYESYSWNILCPCTKYSIGYINFVSMNPFYHPICSSVFISDEWISSFYLNDERNSFENDDFRNIGFSFFETLSMLCHHSEIEVNDIITSLYSESLLSFNLLSRTNFMEKISSDINRFQTNSFELFKRRIYIINQLIGSSFLVNSFHSSMIPIVFRPMEENIEIQVKLIELKQEDGSYCNCTVSLSCESSKLKISSSNDSEYNESFIIPGLKLRCMPIDTCLYSTLECFFNQTCVDILTSYMSISSNSNAIILSSLSHFEMETKIETLAFELMVDNWNFNATYEKYFDKCEPKSCSYTTSTHRTYFNIFIELISLISGLCVVLRIVMMIIVRIIHHIHLRHSTSQRRQTQLSQRRIERLKTILRSIGNIIIELNLFKRSNEPVEERRIYRQRIGTRVYIVLLIIILSILTFYTSLSKEVFRETIINPSESIYFEIESLYSSSLHCQCSQMSISYEIFLSIKPMFHSVCSSDLISFDWINLLRENYRPPPFDYADLFSIGAGLFQLLSTFCETVNTTVYNSLDTFLRRQIVTSEVLSKDLFDKQLTISIDKWRSRITYDFLQTINLFRANMQGNTFLSEEYNFRWHGEPPGFVYLYFNGYLLDFPSIELCSCALSVHCSQTLTLFNGIYNMLTIEGLVLSCTPVTSLMQSDLRVFYNQSFLDEFNTYVIFNSNNFSLNPLIGLDTNETIQSIADRSFVDQWIEDLSFIKYYKACSPQSCTYEIVRHPHFIFIITTMIAAFGGLSTSLKILIEILLFMVNKFQNQLSRRSIQRWFIRFNDRHHLSKRLNVILISISLVGLYFSYSLKTYQQVNELARDPSIEVYLNLVNHYPNESLSCPCSQSSIPYNSFINLSVITYHQVCSKEYLTYEWLSVYLPKLVVLVIDPSPFSDVILNYFQLIGEFCQLSQQTVNTSLTEFLSSSLIETSPNPSSEIFYYFIETKIEYLKKDLSKSMIKTLELLREITHINQLVTIFRSNWKFVQINPITNPVYSDGFIATMKSVLYDDCDCGLSKNCMKSMTDFDNNTILGLMIGCYPIESLLQSSLECFFNETCFQIILSTSYSYTNIETSSLILNDSISSQYNQTTKIEQILNNAFIEQWSINISYEEYYKVCAPSSCSYSYLESSPIVQIITNLLGLYGGLTIIIGNILVPLIIQLGCLLKRPIRHVQSIDQ